MELTELLERARQTFDDTVTRLEGDDWVQPSPCDGWTVRDVVNHVAYGDALVPLLLSSTPLGDLAERDLLGDDPLGSWQRYAKEADAAFASPGAMEQVVSHPEAGDMPGVQLAVFRVVDNVVHSWDVARGAGHEAVLPPDVVAAIYDLVSPFKDALPSMGGFAAGPDVGEDADPTVKFLALFGRDPGWAPTPR